MPEYQRNYVGDAHPTILCYAFINLQITLDRD